MRKDQTNETEHNRINRSAGERGPRNGTLKPTRLTPNEQYTHMSLWSVLCVYSVQYAADVPGHATHLVRLFPREDGRLADGVKDIRMNAFYRRFENLRPLDKPGYHAPKGWLSVRRMPETLDGTCSTGPSRGSGRACRGRMGGRASTRVAALAGTLESFFPTWPLVPRREVC